MSQREQSIRVAIVGLDHWYAAFAIAEAVAEHPGATLVAIADADANRARELADRLGVERVTANPGDVLDDPAIDVVASFVSSDQNPAVCAAAARNGKHIVSVKPVAWTLAEATELRAVIHETGVVFLPSESLPRLATQQQQIRTWLAEGAFGRILSASGTLWTGLPQQWPGDAESGWWIDAARVPGGGWIDHAIYDVDLLRWLLGEEVARAAGIAANLKYPALPVEDFGDALLVFSGGAVLNLDVTWTAAPGGGRRALNIVGSEAALNYDSLTGQLSLAGRLAANGDWQHGEPAAWDTAGIDHLVAAVRGETTPIATIDDAWQNLAACLAFYEAAATGASVAPATLPPRS